MSDDLKKLADDNFQRGARAEREGILLYIQDIWGHLPAESGAARQLESLRRMIMEDKHRSFVAMWIGGQD